MSIRLTILCENSVDSVSPYGLLGEHGFSCHIETADGNFLFDTGGGMTIINNAKLKEIDFTKLQGIMFSHGHIDHTGGLKQVLQATGKVPIYAHPDLFSDHYSKNSGKTHNIGIPWSQAELEKLGANFIFSSTPYQVTENLLLSGEVPRNSTVETGDPNLLALSASGEEVADPLRDDLSLFINSEKGLVILLGCAHAGLLNIIDHAIAVTGQKKIHMVVGGTHLKFCSDEQMAATLNRLDDLDVDLIGASHCTGLRGAQILSEHFGKRFFSASVGREINL
ncbi:7,8-dihydropterin-6-yl-methyl-4-(beta-D-ribofuranosyl)aminobenzene 5'-phosphate synthase [Desulfuromusa kysingii]|uniref:7,8-dihydropterin-6-yl-methyl-4-(Beta-D-ribofuranosyl)aminobenzene 5'-phosphate synthase n=1 Tax=Desulfuromusa kysingii TaxID=37625 RepID=A0A1H3WR64_9BACT|nr:MBL fold metallo-hydrolase [Desulfuromusa kysingii]SDZ89646.1 7,8-dihydropterin-6-yl-methyl-4-(beta-D-ribofuranosyl)aminobenzene 5'-phosphate synthase [Desulfuromusa kysingii]